MLAIGCLIPVVLVIGGAIVGAAAGGQHDAIFGGIGGGVVGIAAMIGMLWVWERIRRRQL